MSPKVAKATIPLNIAIGPAIRVLCKGRAMAWDHQRP
jgi:hypothetical protein